MTCAVASGSRRILTEELDASRQREGRSPIGERDPQNSMRRLWWIRQHVHQPQELQSLAVGYLIEFIDIHLHDPRQ